MKKRITEKNTKKNAAGLVVGIAAGVAAAVAGAFATKKVVKEIKDDLNDFSFVSPDGKNTVTLTYGSSDFAKGLTYVQVKAFVDNSDLECKMIVISIKGTEVFNGQWTDNDNFKLLVGSGKRRQCCDVDFGGEEINMYYYVEKTGEGDDECDDEIIECEVADDETIDAIDAADAE